MTVQEARVLIHQLVSIETNPQEWSQKDIGNVCQAAANYISGTLPKPEDVPYQDILDCYHARLPMLPAVRALNNARKTAMRVRWNEFPYRQNLVHWDDVFATASKSAWLTGDNDKGWRAGFDFFFQPSSLLKLEEGFYDRGQARKTPEVSRDSYLDSIVGEHEARTQRIAGVTR